jgi:uncharacterized protein YukE
MLLFVQAFSKDWEEDFLAASILNNDETTGDGPATCSPCHESATGYSGRTQAILIQHSAFEKATAELNSSARALVESTDKAEAAESSAASSWIGVSGSAFATAAKNLYTDIATSNSELEDLAALLLASDEAFKEADMSLAQVPL